MYARDVRPPSRVLQREVGGCGRRSATHWVSWMRVSSALLRISGADSRYVNARFQILGRSICAAAECECVSRSIPDDKEGVCEDAPREAWPRALRQVGRLALMEDLRRSLLTVSRASSGSISSRVKM